ncbi:ATP-dependent nucleolar RNA helicase, putative [Eimeria praecox]|uniref:RNA helicase n=1 Tax=Eimeria praecox TaxID=51316 RepID=U6GY17_9EIME|nr:ATP-dependent nucleolar RNA helicase, putative [Eimeria praecox]
MHLAFTLQAFNQGLIDILITNDGHCVEEEIPQEADGSESTDASESNQLARKRRREDASKSKEREFAGHRGLDLQGVACVFNFDAPSSLKSYIHRIGRTGRGGATGVAVTLIDTSQEEQQLLLQQMFTVRKAPGALGHSTLTPLSLQLQDVECFRYRVEDVRRGITKRVIAAAVARDLQQQLLNSRKLKEFFERNPRDREVLKRACKQLKMTAIQLAIQQQTSGAATTRGSHGASRRRPVADPLKSFKAAV